MSAVVTRRLFLRAKPDLAAWVDAYPDRYPAVFESAAVGEPLGRFDILLRSAGAAVTLTGDGRLIGEYEDRSGFLKALDAWWQAQRVDIQSCSLPFHGGWGLYLGYELAAEVEPKLTLAQSSQVVAHAIRAPAAVIWDHLNQAATLVAERGYEELLDAMEADLQAVPVPSEPRVQAVSVFEDEPEEYLHAVEKALAYIASGDVYQANLSRKWRTALSFDACGSEFYNQLRRANPGPFSGRMHVPGMEILSTSPERLVEVRHGYVQTRPIAGTRSRAVDDQAAIHDLLASAKEKAEHVMLIDLARNDLGRLCEPGTVKVDEFGVVESYAHVHHLVSNVKGRLLANLTPGDVIRGVFPGGTITGCPKVRCMQIISEIEGVARGAYTGSFGYLNRDGTLDLNILIRTATIANGFLEVRAGAGVVADSQPQKELDETRAKARGLLRGLGVRT